jgi:hypothetical protein
MLLIERSESQIPAGILGRLRPMAEAVLNRSELGISEMIGAPVPDDVCDARSEPSHSPHTKPLLSFMRK